ncbi:MAG: class I SAM-dependent methyltransferase [Bacteroidales bacterium]|nr:class I SAM-dependent methyltransferase [Bacteroidales bacterium]
MNLSFLFYRVLIDPLLNGLRHSIKSQISKGSSCLDIACGTGSLVFALKDKCQSVTGIDLDEPKISEAQRIVESKGLDHLSFRVMDATNLNEFEDEQFDFVTMAMAIHQFDPELREKVLLEAVRVSKKLIVADYAYPLPASPSGWMARFIESIAGEDHSRNFKHYDKNDGMEPILKSMNLSFELAAKRGVGVFAVYVISD